MHYSFDIEPYVYDVVADLQDAGFETYIVGGAIRDLLQNREPKDYDISTAATPQEVRKVFGRRARIIGRRFQLVHVSCGREILEVSTFRRAPCEDRHTPLTAGARKIAQLEEAENMIFNDNDFGTSEEDAWRRDFTVNALFYNPVAEEVLDYTQKGFKDIEAGVVRAIGDPKLRFEEDPVRMLRALKLVGQYNFKLESATDVALRSTLPLLELASVSRLSLELEKVMKSSYAGSIMKIFDEYGLLTHFLPWAGKLHGTEIMHQALELLCARDRRVRAGFYRSSISLAMAAFALPFIGALQSGKLAMADAGSDAEPEETAEEILEAHEDWEAETPEDFTEDQQEEQRRKKALLSKALRTVYSPLTVIKRLTYSACRMLSMQAELLAFDNPKKLIRMRGFPHAMELLKIRFACQELECDETLFSQWRKVLSNMGGVNAKSMENSERSGQKSSGGRKRSRRRGKCSQTVVNAAPQAVSQDDDSRCQAEIAAAAADLTA